MVKIKNIKLSELLNALSNNYEIDFEEIRTFLSVESREARAIINKAIAVAYFEAGNSKAAKIFADRALDLYNYDSEFPESIKQIYIAENDFNSLRELYKKYGMHAAKQNDIEKALNYFNLTQNVFERYNGVDQYQSDIEIIEIIHKLAEPYRFNAENIVKYSSSEKIRIAYLLKGITDVNSVLIKISQYFEKFHDNDKFEIKFFTPETEYQISQHDCAIETVGKFLEYGDQIEFAQQISSKLETSLQIATRINEFNPHFLVGNAILQNFFDYFIMALNPAMINLGFLAGPIPLFVSPKMDWIISFYNTLHREAPSNSTHIPLEVDLPSDIIPVSKTTIGVPENHILLASAARSSKFQNYEFWKSLINILKQNTNTSFIAIGTEKDSIPFLEELIPNELRSRFIFTGWISDYQSYLASIDIFINTYPTGSGVSFMDCLALGKPALTFSHNNIERYTPLDSASATEFFNINELIIDRGNFHDFENTISKLILDKSFRDEMGSRCKSMIFKNSGSPIRMVKKFEETLFNIIEKKKTNFKNDKRELNDLIVEARVFEKNIFEKKNFLAWQEAYKNGYNSSMGNHRNYFYDVHLQNIGLYEAIDKSKNIIEFAPGDAGFIKQFIESSPNKEFSLVDISEENLKKVQNLLEKFPNAKTYLNFPERKSFQNIDLAFSFLLCQSMPRSLWLSHLETVFNMLKKDGSYFFQFAYKNNESSNDSIETAISGSNKYRANEIAEMLEKIGFSGCDLTVPITLEKFESDIVWYICKATK